MFPYQEYFLKATIYLLVRKNLHATVKSAGKTTAGPFVKVAREPPGFLFILHRSDSGARDGGKCCMAAKNSRSISVIRRCRKQLVLEFASPPLCMILLSGEWEKHPRATRVAWGLRRVRLGGD